MSKFPARVEDAFLVTVRALVSRVSALELRAAQTPTIDTEKRFTAGAESVGISATSVTVTLPDVVDTNYSPFGTASWNCGGVWVTNITASQFTLNWSTSAGSGSPVVRWGIIRYVA